MNAVDPPPRSADATNSNGAGVGSTCAGWLPSWSVAGHSGYGRSETSHGSQIADMCAFFQGAFSGCRVRSQWESGMPDPWDEPYSPLDTKGVSEILESPIERRLVGGFDAVHYCREVKVRFVLGKSRADELPGIRNAEQYPGLWLHIFPQEVVGPYRADFLIVAGLNGRCKTLIVECDGEEFHRDRMKDWERDQFMERLEYRVIRFKGADIWRDVFKCARYVIEVANRYLAEPEPEYTPKQKPLYPDNMKPFSQLLMGILSAAEWNYYAEYEEQRKRAENTGEGEDYE
jgi:very-short-patch-repair endonuclease